MKPAELYTHTHTQLRRCLAFLLFAVLSYSSFATTACVPNDNVAIILDPNIAPSYYFPEGQHVSSDSSGAWYFDTNGLRLYGSSACVSNNAYFDADERLWDGDTLVQNEHNSGNYCYCKLTQPVVSKWVYINSVGSTSCDWFGGTYECGCTPKACKYWCGWVAGQASGYLGLRNKLFSSIKQ